MSFFNKVLASVGIGGATIDTKLEKDKVIPGEELTGVVEIRGGKVVQTIDDIYFSINTEYFKEINDKKVRSTAAIERIRLATGFKLEPNESREIPFSIQIPLDTPVTLGRTQVWVKTGLDIKNTIDPADNDYLRVLPSSLLNGVVDGLTGLGFRLREVECEQASYRYRQRLPFIQEFEFVPIAGTYRGRLDELELIFIPISQTQAELYFQVDRKARGLGSLLAEAFEMDETNVHMSVSLNDLSTMQSKLSSMLQRYS